MFNFIKKIFSKKESKVEAEPVDIVSFHSAQVQLNKIFYDDLENLKNNPPILVNNNKSDGYIAVVLDFLMSKFQQSDIPPKVLKAYKSIVYNHDLPSKKTLIKTGDIIDGVKIDMGRGTHEQTKPQNYNPSKENFTVGFNQIGAFDTKDEDVLTKNQINEIVDSLIKNETIPNYRK